MLQNILLLALAPLAITAQYSQAAGASSFAPAESLATSAVSGWADPAGSAAAVSGWASSAVAGSGSAAVSGSSVSSDSSESETTESAGSDDDADTDDESSAAQGSGAESSQDTTVSSANAARVGLGSLVIVAGVAAFFL